jgi:hypothetical protein
MDQDRKIEIDSTATGERSATASSLGHFIP